MSESNNEQSETNLYDMDFYRYALSHLLLLLGFEESDEWEIGNDPNVATWCPDDLKDTFIRGCWYTHQLKDLDIYLIVCKDRIAIQHQTHGYSGLCVQFSRRVWDLPALQNAISTPLGRVRDDVLKKELIRFLRDKFTCSDIEEWSNSGIETVTRLEEDGTRTTESIRVEGEGSDD